MRKGVAVPDEAVKLRSYSLIVPTIRLMTNTISSIQPTWCTAL
jgi:hypothetical protein